MDMTGFIKKISEFEVRVKNDPKLLEALEKLENKSFGLDEWQTIVNFVARLKAEKAESALFQDDDEIRKANKNYVNGQMDLALLPELAKGIRQAKKKKEESTIEKTKDALRRKFNPGAFER
jgi:hypothetical protein